MAFFIDTANVEEAKGVKQFGWVRGVTTNPVLLADAGETAENTLRELAKIDMGLLFYQLTATSIKGMQKEAHVARELIGDQLVLKIPPNKQGFQAISLLPSHIPCCITALYSVSQSVIAREIGVQYIALYVNRVTKYLGDGIALLRDISHVLRGSSTQILAASIKSPEEACAALVAGADHVTLPFEVLQSLTYHKLSEEAVHQFHSKGIGLRI